MVLIDVLIKYFDFALCVKIKLILRKNPPTQTLFFVARVRLELWKRVGVFYQPLADEIFSLEQIQ